MILTNPALDLISSRVEAGFSVCYSFLTPCGREMMIMARFVPKDKLSKKAQKELNRQRRVTWDFSPVTKTVDSKKLYNRKRKAQNRDDYGLGFLL